MSTFTKKRRIEFEYNLFGVAYFLRQVHFAQSKILWRHKTSSILHVRFEQKLYSKFNLIYFKL